MAKDYKVEPMIKHLSERQNRIDNTSSISTGAVLGPFTLRHNLNYELSGRNRRSPTIVREGPGDNNMCASVIIVRRLSFLYHNHLYLMY